MALASFDFVARWLPIGLDYAIVPVTLLGTLAAVRASARGATDMKKSLARHNERSRSVDLLSALEHYLRL